MFRVLVACQLVVNVVRSQPSNYHVHIVAWQFDTPVGDGDRKKVHQRDEQNLTQSSFPDIRPESCHWPRTQLIASSGKCFLSEAQLQSTCSGPRSTFPLRVPQCAGPSTTTCSHTGTKLHTGMVVPNYFYGQYYSCTSLMQLAYWVTI